MISLKKIYKENNIIQIYKENKKIYKVEKDEISIQKIY